MTDAPNEELPDALRDLPPDETTNAIAAVSREIQKKSATRQIAEIGFSLVLVLVIFVFVIPKITGADYANVWAEMGKLSSLEITGLFVVWILGMLAYTGVLTNTLPGLKHMQALCVNLAGSAVSNLLPFGGAVGAGATYAINMSWGFKAPAITLSILVSGIWNVLAKLAMPLLAVILLLLARDTTGKLILPAVLGLIILVSAVVILGLIVRSERLALQIGRIGQSIVGWICRIAHHDNPPDIATAILSFRRQSIGLVKEHWLFITLWIFLFNLTQFLLLFACIRAVGINGITLTEAFAAFAFARLLETIPLTPGGVGFVEVGTASALISFGGAENAATAAVFLFRGFVYLLEIPLGALAWVAWATMLRWRRPVGSART